MRESRAFRPSSCGDCRAPAGASGDLLRDVRGMRVLSQLPTNGMCAGCSRRPRLRTSRILDGTRRDEASSLEAAA
jgi:hypothetical protein